MIELGEETYLLAAEAARHLKVSRVKFYEDYRRDLEAVKVGRFRRKHYRLSDLEKLHSIQPIPAAS